MSEKQTVENVIKRMKDENLFLRVDLTGIEHIDYESTKTINCGLYKNMHYVIPQQVSKFTLQEKNVYELLDILSKRELWMCDDTDLMSNYFIRYFATKKTFSGEKWVNTAEIQRK